MSNDSNAVPGTEAAVFNQEGTVKTWDDDYYHPIAIKYYDAAIPQMLKEMGLSSGDRVLDAGCGPGVHSIRAAAYGCKVTAMDLSSTMLRHAASRAKAASLEDRIEFRQGDLTKPDLGEQFGAVFSWGVVIHVPDTEAALDGLASLVAPGGRLTLQVMNDRSFDYRFEKLLRKLLRRPFAELVETKLGSGNWYQLGDERLWVLRFNMGALDKAMKSRGFSLVSRRPAEFSEFQRRLPGALRRPVLHLNTLIYRLRILTGLSATQMIFYSRDA
ncbi:MAG: methyltransferase domain-containing protein [Rhodobacterales bacterium]|nr:methyltransferase domain-containing protein [Rhodobacterales bacterium]